MAATTKPIPLIEFTKLTPTMLFYKPHNHSPTSPTILLHTWLNAAPSNIQFYVRNWRSLLPTARIILILGVVPDLVYIPTDVQKRNFHSVLSLLRAEPASPLYAHLFSNGGAHSLTVLLRAFKETSADQATLLPLKGVLFESAPSRGTYTSAYVGISYEVARFPLYIRYPMLALIHIFVTFIGIREMVFGKLNVVSRLNEDLNDDHLVIQGTPRAYFYSKEDKLVKWEDVEYHAAAAKDKGWLVKMERFSGTDHCRHGKSAGEEKYWNVCREMVGSSGT